MLQQEDGHPTGRRTPGSRNAGTIFFSMMTSKQLKRTRHQTGNGSSESPLGSESAARARRLGTSLGDRVSSSLRVISGGTSGWKRPQAVSHYI